MLRHAEAELLRVQSHRLVDMRRRHCSRWVLGKLVLTGGAVINAASTRTAKCQLSRPRFFKASVRRLPRCQPLSWLMHQVRSQVMVQFRGSTTTLRVGRVLKPFASATFFCKAGSAAQVNESICALCPVSIKRFQPRRSCRDELTLGSSPSRFPVRA